MHPLIGQSVFRVPHALVGRVQYPCDASQLARFAPWSTRSSCSRAPACTFQCRAGAPVTCVRADDRQLTAAERFRHIPSPRYLAPPAPVALWPISQSYTARFGRHSEDVQLSQCPGASIRTGPRACQTFHLFVSFTHAPLHHACNIAQ